MKLDITPKYCQIGTYVCDDMQSNFLIEENIQAFHHTKEFKLSYLKLPCFCK